MENKDVIKSMSGVKVIAHVVKTLPQKAGVYRMLDKNENVLYVGKAKNLPKRVVAYTHVEKLPNRLKRMVHETASMEIITTQSESEALLLEANLIKKLKPRYNILLRDDKSQPYITIRRDHHYPQIVKTRQVSELNEMFGPFSSTQAVNNAMSILQKAFLLRSCTDSVFASRDRPCLLYHIKRCSAPCVGKVTEATYNSFLIEARRYLKGQSKGVQRSLEENMIQASQNQDYERAAVYRDRIRALNKLQEYQGVIFKNLQSADVIALHQAEGHTCIQIFFFRKGWSHGNTSFYPTRTADMSEEEILSLFIANYYGSRQLPKELILSHKLPDKKLLQEAFEAKSEHKVSLTLPLRGEKLEALMHAKRNAKDALQRHLNENATQVRNLNAVAEKFSLDHSPERIEIYDNSHTQGANPYGCMVVMGQEGFEKKHYRKFKIKSDIAPGDDYGMMREVFQRRFKEAGKEGTLLPDLVLIDGGKGHLSAAQEVMNELGLGDLSLVAISKGVDRNAGREFFHQPNRDSFQLPVDDKVLYFLQRLRDEAHRFAIGTHRQGRTKSLIRSKLDGIEGIGARRKKSLLLHFGSVYAIEGAGLKELQSVSGISKDLAVKIYEYFRSTD